MRGGGVSETIRCPSLTSVSHCVDALGPVTHPATLRTRVVYSRHYPHILSAGVFGETFLFETV